MINTLEELKDELSRLESLFEQELEIFERETNIKVHKIIINRIKHETLLVHSSDESLTVKIAIELNNLRN